MPDIKISPSILSCDFGRLNEEIAEVEPYSDYIHVDVMDGHFVPNITLGPPIVEKIRTKLPMDIHLMIENPENYIEAFVKAVKKSGNAHAPIIGVQVEACKHLDRVIHQIKDLGARAEVVLNPATPLENLEYVLEGLDQVLLMTVNPGFGGQEFIDSVVPKIMELRKMAPTLDIEVDGGINEKTVKIAKEAGANVIVAGSYIFEKKDRAGAVKNLREA